MTKGKAIPKSCWTCDKSTNCYAHYGEGACKYKIAIEEQERKGGKTNGK